MKHQSGSVSLTFATVLIVLLGFVALALDLARLYLGRGTLQAATDAAALAGSRQLDGTIGGTLNAVLAAEGVLSRYALALERNLPVDPRQATFRLGACASPDTGTSPLHSGSVTALHWTPLVPGCIYLGATDNATTTGVTNATGLQFLEVDTGAQGALTPFFAQGLNALGVTASPLTPYGYAVGGRIAPFPALLYR